MASGGCKDKMSEETFDFICTSCADEDVINEAVKYCVECQGYCCHSCVGLHRKFPVLKSHTLLDDLKSTTTGQQKKLPEVPTEKCNIHETKLVDMYCKEHDIVGCYVCFVENHKSCKGPHSVLDAIDELYSDSEYRQTSELLKDTVANMQMFIELSKKEHGNLKKSKEIVIETIKSLRKELDTLLDKLEEQSLQELEEKYEKIESKKLKVQADTDNNIATLRQLEERMIKAGENRSQRFVCMKLACTKIGEFKATKVSTMHPPEDQLTFVLDTSLTDIHQHLQKFGEINTMKEDIYKIMETNTIDIHLPNERTKCNSWGSCVTEDDMLLVTNYHNRRLKRINISSLSMVDYLDLPLGPYGVCTVNEHEVAVACDESTVQFVNVSKQMTLFRRIGFNHMCYGIAFNNNKLFITDYMQSVYIYTMVGSQLKKVTPTKAGKRLFTSSRFITINKSTGMVFVGGSQEGLLCFDKDLNHVASLCGFGTTIIDGCCVDGRGNIFVALATSGSVVQFSEDGVKRGEVVTSSLLRKSPLTVCYHQGMKRLFVIKPSTVYVYDLL